VSGRAVVLGAGWNGLAAAVALARAGRRAVVVDAGDAPGGLAAVEEFHPGHRAPGVERETRGLLPDVARRLELEDHGLVRLAEREPLVALEPRASEGDGLVLPADAARAAEELERRSRADAPAYAELRARLERVRPLLERLLQQAPPDVRSTRPGELLALARTALGLWRLGASERLELLRIAPMCAADWVRETHADGLVCALLCSVGVEGVFGGPHSAGTAATLLLREACAYPPVRGGPAALTEALESAARARGVELLLGRTVERIRVEAGRATGVVLAGGDELDAELVVSTLDPRHTLLELCPAPYLPARLRRSVAGIRARGTAAVLHVALRRPPRWCGRPGEVDRATPLARLRVPHDVDGLERAFDAAKHRRLPERPWLEVHVASAERPELAPDGAASLTVVAHGVPTEPDGGWTDAARRTLEERVLAQLGATAEGLEEDVVGTRLSTPPDLAARYRIPGGHLLGGEAALDQLWFQRPTLGTSRHATPLPGLFLGGRGGHPGGDFPCAGGLLAAERALAR